MRTEILTILLLFCCLPGFSQADRHDVRAGNRKFGKEHFKEAEIDYRKAVLKDSTSVTAQYDLASALYRQEDWAGAAKALESVKDQPELPAQYYFNAGDAASQQKDWQAAVNDFREALLRDPGDLDAKENYIYAKKMLENQQNGGGGGNDNQQDQNQDQQNQNQDQNKDQDKNQNQDQNQQDQQQGQQDQQQDQQDQQDQQPQISPQQAQQMLRAIQAKEKETQDKVNKEKAALLKSRQKEKNW
ncbi:MAG: tetratricopeptide repeat protein [Bacteroidales bacterium]|nr:tetratricopeptide repeat protein [Bacteroidales bacterium]